VKLHANIETGVIEWLYVHCDICNSLSTRQYCKMGFEVKRHFLLAFLLLTTLFLASSLIVSHRYVRDPSNHLFFSKVLYIYICQIFYQKNVTKIMMWNRVYLLLLVAFLFNNSFDNHLGTHWPFLGKKLDTPSISHIYYIYIYKLF
jgi:hypothetical protein